MIRLKRTIPVESFDVQATVAIGRQRPEWLAVAQLAADLGPLDGATITRELGLPGPVGLRVLNRCIDLGLLDRPQREERARLSATGRIALDAGEVLVSEEGVWRVFTCNDPMIGHPVLHVVRLPDIFAESERKALRRDSHHRSPDPSPSWLTGGRGRVWKSVTSNGPRFELRELASQGQRGPGYNIALQLEWATESAPQLRLLGHWDVDVRTRNGEERDKPTRIPIDESLPPPNALSELGYDDLWSELASQGSGVELDMLRAAMARTNRRVVPGRFDELADAQLVAMRRSITVSGFQHRRLGRFDSTTLTEVDLAPATDKDAQSWAEWRLWHDLTAYVTPEQLRERSDAARAPFHSYRVDMPSPEVWLERAKRNATDPKSRFILAPADLGLWRKS